MVVVPEWWRDGYAWIASFFLSGDSWRVERFCAPSSSMHDTLPACQGQACVLPYWATSSVLDTAAGVSSSRLWTGAGGGDDVGSSCASPRERSAPCSAPCERKTMKRSSSATRGPYTWSSWGSSF